MLELIKSYVENRFQLIKLELVAGLSNVVGKLINSFVILLISLFILLMFSFSIAFWLSEILKSNAIGFAIVGGIYLVIAAIYLIFSRHLVEVKVKDIIVRTAFSTENEFDQD